MTKKTFAVTGCLGFMGSHFTRACLARGYHVWGIDKITYAAQPVHLEEFQKTPHFKFTQDDIVTMSHLYDVDAVINFAAETHVDNSIMDSRNFTRTNVLGVENLMELIRGKRNYEMPLFVQIGTDEVYGDVREGLHSEDNPLKPSNPYSASKASADMLIFGWHRTHEVPFNIIRSTNNYGLHQYPEKLIPKAVKYLSLDRPIPIHGDGTYRRNWLHVEDMAEGVFTVIEKGERNRIYNLSGSNELSNIEVVEKIITFYFGKNNFPEWKKYVKFNFVRMGEDIRYSLDDSAIRSLGWSPKRSFAEELKNLVDFYKKHFIW